MRGPSLPSNQRTCSNPEPEASMDPPEIRSGRHRLRLADRLLGTDSLMFCLLSVHGATQYLEFAQGSPAAAQGSPGRSSPAPLDLAEASAASSPRRFPPSPLPRSPPACSAAAGRSPWCGTRCPAPSPARSGTGRPCSPPAWPAGPGARRRARAPSPTQPAEEWPWRGWASGPRGRRRRVRGGEGPRGRRRVGGLRVGSSS